jgi:RimJ/RimL family protein N-acetyltransferase
MSGLDEHWLPPDRFETERLVIRSWHEGDGAALTEATNSSHEHLAPWMDWSKPDQSVEESETIVRAARGRWLLKTDFTIAFFSRDESRVLGGSGFHLREGALRTRRAEIGMWIRSSEAGTGLGTEALDGLLEWGFTDWPWLRLSWRCDPRNVASVRVAEKAGLTAEGVDRDRDEGTDGTLQDVARFAMLRRDWEARRG